MFALFTAYFPGAVFLAMELSETCDKKCLDPETLHESWKSSHHPNGPDLSSRVQISVPLSSAMLPAPLFMNHWGLSAVAACSLNSLGIRPGLGKDQCPGAEVLLHMAAPFGRTRKPISSNRILRSFGITKNSAQRYFAFWALCDNQRQCNQPASLWEWPLLVTWRPFSSVKAHGTTPHKQTTQTTRFISPRNFVIYLHPGLILQILNV